MNLITGVDMITELATVYDLDDDGLPACPPLPVTGLTRQEAIDLIEKVAADLLMQEDRRDNPHFASQGIGWRPQQERRNESCGRLPKSA